MRRKLLVSLSLVLVLSITLGATVFANPVGISYRFEGYGGTAQAYCGPLSGAVYTSYSGSSYTISVTCRYNYKASTDNKTYTSIYGGSIQNNDLSVVAYPSKPVLTPYYTKNTSVIATSSNAGTINVTANYN